MSTTAPTEPPRTVEERLTALESALTILQNQIGEAKVDPDWIEKLIGSMDGKSGFRELVQYGKQFRESHPYLDEDADAW